MLGLVMFVHVGSSVQCACRRFEIWVSVVSQCQPDGLLNMVPSGLSCRKVAQPHESWIDNGLMATDQHLKPCHQGAQGVGKSGTAVLFVLCCVAVDVFLVFQCGLRAVLAHYFCSWFVLSVRRCWHSVMVFWMCENLHTPLGISGKVNTAVC
jgi:hypothetical protein